MSGLEEIPTLVNPHLASLTEEELNTVCNWTVEALDYNIAQKQQIAVNIRQLKAGMRLTSCLSSGGEILVKKLMVRTDCLTSQNFGIKIIFCVLFFF